MKRFFEFNRLFSKEKPDFLVAVDPGLQGGCCAFSLQTQRLLVFELPTKIVFKKEKKIIVKKKELDLRLFLSSLQTFFEEETDHPSVWLLLEKPFKRQVESVNAFAVSMKMFGQILALFSLSFETKIWSLAPLSWTSYFDKEVEVFLEKPKVSKEEQKKRRALFLEKVYEIETESLYSQRGRLKDGIVDALGMLVFFGNKGTVDHFWQY